MATCYNLISPTPYKRKSAKRFSFEARQKIDFPKSEKKQHIVCVANSKKGIFKGPIPEKFGFNAVPVEINSMN